MVLICSVELNTLCFNSEIGGLFMNILYYFKELETPMYYWQRLHWIDELTRNGHKVFTLNSEKFDSYAEANVQILKYIKKEKKIDVFFTCVGQDIIYNNTIKEISRFGIPTCLIAFDNLELPFLHKDIADVFDLVWLTSYETRYLFEKWGCEKILFQTYAANPYFFQPLWSKQINSVGFIGSPYGSRVNKINDLIRYEIPCAVYSNSLFNKGYNQSVGDVYILNYWDLSQKMMRYLRFPIGRKVLYSTIKNKIVKKSLLIEDSPFLFKYQSVSDEEMIRLYSNFALSLNITELRDTYILNNPIHKIHLRSFEIPMSGGLQFASYNEELASYFEDGKEIVLYHNKDEMIEKARYYLDPKHENEVMNMKLAARKRAESEHTWTHRFNSVFELLGLK